jgi:hypothetical protein
VSGSSFAPGVTKVSRERVPVGRSRYGAIVTATGETLEPSRSDHRCPTPAFVWPQWQGAGTESVRSLAPEFPFDIARRGYSVGTKVLEAVLPEHDGPIAIVPVEMGDIGLEERDGIEAKAVVLQQLRSALAIIQEHEPARITTVGGECSISMAPFSYLNQQAWRWTAQRRDRFSVDGR